MTLSNHANFPSTRCYVLKLHRNALPAQGRLCGRMEHIASGDHIDFDSGDELLAWIALHGAKIDAAVGEAEAS